MDSPEVEKEVKRLLREDCNAVRVCILKLNYDYSCRVRNVRPEVIRIRNVIVHILCKYIGFNREALHV